MRRHGAPRPSRKVPGSNRGRIHGGRVIDRVRGSRRYGEFPANLLGLKSAVAAAGGHLIPPDLQDETAADLIATHDAPADARPVNIEEPEAEAVGDV